MSKTGPTRKADVYVGDRYAGSLERTPTGGSFTYALDYLALPHPEPVASTLPLRTQSYHVYGVNLHSYFANLLPEGLRLDAVASRVKTSRDDRLSLLVAAGDDAIGDVSVHDPAGKQDRSPSTIDPGSGSFRAVFNERYGLDAKFFERVSIPGVQEKVSASRISAPMLVKSRRQPESIVKLNFNQHDRPRLVENEYFFMRMAKDCGLEVAECDQITDKEGDTALVVTRFDRIVHQEDTVKLHQEDACQFLDLYPDHKYDISIQQIAKGVASICTAPEVEILRLLELYAFSYIIGNGDLHGKNISILRDENKISRLSPAYDLLSTWPYRDFRMALKLDGRDRKFRSAHFLKFGERFGVREKAIRNMLGRLYEKSAPWQSRIAEIGLHEDLAGPLQTIIGIRRGNIVS